MNWLITLYVFLLFLLLTPGVVLQIPSNGNKMTVALTHAVVFALVWHFTHKLVWNTTMRIGMPM
jgi:hypothetical protein